MASRRQYTAEFKREAVRLAHERGNKSAVARELNIHVSLLRRWTQELEGRGEKAFPGQGTPGTRSWLTFAANSNAPRRRTPFGERYRLAKRLWVSSRAALAEIPFHRSAPRAVLRQRYVPRLEGLHKRIL